MHHLAINSLVAWQNAEKVYNTYTWHQWKIQTRFVLDFPLMENPDQIRVGFSVFDGKSRWDSCWIFHLANLHSWLMKTLTILHLAHLVALQNVEDMDHCHKHVQSRFKQWMAALICLQNLHPHLFALWINAHPLQQVSGCHQAVSALYYCTRVTLVYTNE